MADLTLTTSDGERLQAESAGSAEPSLAVVITHPHPLMGGDMYTPVPGGFFRAACERSGVAALRFNFRGVVNSTGVHDEGRAERLDVAAAIEHLASAAPGVPLVLAGWSFGADVSLTVDDDRVAGWYLAAPPLRVVDPAEMAAASSPAPKVLAVGERDQFNPPTGAAATTRGWSNTRVDMIAGADHFFGVELPHLVDGFTTFLDAVVQGS